MKRLAVALGVTPGAVSRALSERQAVKMRSAQIVSAAKARARELKKAGKG